MSMPWFRLYAEFAADPVIQSLAFEDQRHYVVILCMKCSGTLDRELAREARERIICRGLGLDPITAAEAKRRLAEVGLVDDEWQPKGWDKRQFSSDKSTDRVRNHRENKRRGNVTSNVTRNVSVPVTPSVSVRSGNGPDTDTDTDKDLSPEERSTTPNDVRAQLVAQAVEKIASTNRVSTAHARSFVISLCTGYGEQLTHTALAAMLHAAPVDPVGWLRARLKRDHENAVSSTGGGRGLSAGERVAAATGLDFPDARQGAH